MVSMTFTILGAIIALSFVIFFHELGHFLLAKRCRIKVEKFSLGLGPKIIGFKRGETEYLLSAIPFGGYVKMAGENLHEATGQEGEFASAPIWQRAKVIFSGSFFNILSAVLILAIVYMIGFPVFSNQIEVKEESFAQKAGLKTEDRIIEIANKKVKDWEDLTKQAYKNLNKDVNIVVKRNQQLLTFQLHIPKEGLLKLGISPFLPPIIGGLRMGYPASLAGLKEGDKIISINETKVSTWTQMADIIHKKADKEIKVCVKRKDKLLEFRLTPRKEEFVSPDGRKETLGIIGIQPKMGIKRYNPIKALGCACVKSIQLIRDLFYILGKLFTFQVSIKNLVGPIGIVMIAGEQAKMGLASFLLFVAFLSLNLGVLNLLPIPILDGGHLLFLAIEGIRKKPVSAKVQEFTSRVGLSFLLCLMLVVTYHDIVRVLSNLLKLFK